jgi:hypothetical protein
VTGRCHWCGAEISQERVGARDVCDRCRAYLHCCRNCDFFAPGAHNDCREPSAEPVANKEQGNFCDFFRLGAVGARAAAGRNQARAALDRLFRRK